MSKALATKTVAAALLGSVLIVGFAFAFAKPAKADTVSDLQAQVQALLAQIAALQGSNSTISSTSAAGCFTFTRNQKRGDSGGEVMWIQEFLNAHGFQISASGAGSPGNETSYFGARTKAAVVAFQNAYASDVLTPVGLTVGTGYWGPSTRAKANAICASSAVTTTTPTPTGTPTGTGTGTPTGTGTIPTGPGITVSAAAQPVNSLAPQNASRVPFTAFTLTNNSTSTVTITSVTVQRAGLAQDATFSGVELLDSTGVQVGISHTFNSNHQANIGDGFTLAPGQSMTYTVAGNMAASESSYAGEVASVSVVGVNTSVPVTGSLPITGASQTINATLAIGAVSTSTSSYDPGAAQTKNIGNTSVHFSGVRFTANSSEDLKLFNIRWRQVGTASALDISNVVTVVGGTSYPTTVDASGKYYTTVFPGGILIPKGNSVDVYVQGDLSGSSSASRTVQMNIDKVTDVYFVGQLYGYGVAPSGTYTPWYVGYATTINGGTATSIQNATSVAAANVPLNVNNTVLGGFQTNFTGEPVTVTGIKIAVATSSGATGGGVTSVSIVDENGAVVAGPVDEPSTATTGSLLTFTDSVTFPTGVHTYTLKGKIPTGWTNGSTLTLSTTPSTQWTSPTGQTTGNSVTLPSSTVTMNQQTVKAATLTITASPNPVATTIVPGNALTLGNIQLDASQSGEDITLSSLPVSIIVSATANATDLNTCQVYNGAAPGALNNGGNVVNPSSSTTDTTNTTTAKNLFTFDSPLTIPKGTVVTLAVKCNIVSSPTITSAQIGVNSSNTYTGTGAQSGSSMTPTATTGASGVQTITASGSFTVKIYTAGSPALALVPGGTTGQIDTVLDLRATNENVNLTKLGFTLVNSATSSQATADGKASYAATDIQVNGVHILDASNNPVGTATFTGTNLTATSTLSKVVNLPVNTDVYLTVKLDLANIGTGQPGGIADKVIVDPLNAEGTGASSGKTIPVGATSGASGVKLFKSVPSLANGTVSCSNSSTPVCNGTNQILKKFTVTANSTGPIGIEQLAFNVSTSSASLTNVKLYAYTDSGYSQGVANQGSGTGQVNSWTLCSSGCSSTSPTLTFETASSSPIEIPAGGTIYFALLGTVSPSTTSWNVGATLAGTSSIPTPLYNNFQMSTSSSPALGLSEFIWSDNASTTAVAADVDWTNGYQVQGLSSTGL